MHCLVHMTWLYVINEQLLFSTHAYGMQASSGNSLVFSWLLPYCASFTRFDSIGIYRGFESRMKASVPV